MHWASGIPCASPGGQRASFVRVQGDTHGDPVRAPQRHAGHALKKRKPITALLIPTSNDSNLLVVCDDGSVWLKRHVNAHGPRKILHRALRLAMIQEIRLRGG